MVVVVRIREVCRLTRLLDTETADPTVRPLSHCINILSGKLNRQLYSGLIRPATIRRKLTGC